MTESNAPAPPHPPTGPTPTGALPAGRVVRRSMVVRHIVGTVIALVATPIGILVFDYGASEYLIRRAVRFEDGFSFDLVVMFVGGAVLLAVAASARLSGLGPIVAAIVWCTPLLLWFVFDPGSFYDFSRDLPGSRFWFRDPPFLFGLVAPLLIGSGIAGRWRGAAVPAARPWAPDYR